MFLSTILAALIVGALLGGRIPRLADLQLKWPILLIVALGLRLGTGLIGELNLELPLGWTYIAGYGLIIVWLWFNWRVPGLQVAAVGIGANLVAVLANGGQMPIWAAAFSAAGFTEAQIANDSFHVLLRAATIAQFVASGGLLGDVVPLPIPVIRDVVSLGDLLLALGIFWAIVYSMTRSDAPTRSALALGGTSVLMPAIAAPAMPMGGGVPYAGGGRIPAEMTAQEADARGIHRQSPYLRLARNRSFALLWVGQLVSLFGERLHQVALAFIVFQATGSAVEVGFTFAAAAVPNILLGPLAGALVDRWDRRWTMIGCDVVRAGLVISVPFVLQVDVRLVYVMAFLIATVTLLFRPAKTAVIPQIVKERDLVTANSASSIADGAADLVGLPLAGVLLATLGSVELAFAIDAATYVVSAVLLLGVSVPRDPSIGATSRIGFGAVWREMGEGWRFLTHQSELFTNTILSTVAQLAVGAEIVATFPYAVLVLETGNWDPVEVYAWILGAIALGSVVGGIVIGGIGDRIRKGPMIIAGFIGMGLALAAAGFVTHPLAAIGLFFVVGLTNMMFIIPTITLFQQRTPGRLMGRVVSSRQALVFGAIAASMAVSGVLADAIGAGTVLVLFGGICAAAGVIGLLLPSMRNAR
ncbi:MAG: MFS transporter [Candidatus Limnocylindria bacterium]